MCYNPLRYAVLAAVALVLAPPAFSSLILVSDRTSLAPDDSFAWSSLGGELTTVSSGSTAVSTGGLSFKVSKPSGGDFQTLEQGSLYQGNFAPGDSVLWSAAERGPITFEFASLVSGGGLQIQNDIFGPFIARIEAFDGSGGILGSFDVAGTSNDAGDGSAIFLGVLSDSSDIKRLTFDIEGSDLFAIGDLAIRGGISAIPEPGSTVAGVGLILAIVLARLRNRQRTGRS